MPTHKSRIVQAKEAEEQKIKKYIFMRTKIGKEKDSETEKDNRFTDNRMDKKQARQINYVISKRM